MDKILISFLAPITFTKYAKFTLCWTVISVAILLSIGFFADRNINIIKSMLSLSILGLAFSFSRFGVEFKQNKLKLSWLQGVRCLPAVLLLWWLSSYSNAVDVSNTHGAGYIIAFIGFWSSQVAAALRSFFK
jgi:hypothetical protein